MKTFLMMLILTSSVYSQSKEEVIYWKHSGVGGIEFRDGEIVKWPDELPAVTEENMSLWTSEYVAAKQVSDKQKRIDATNEEMSRLVEHIVVRLLEKRVMNKSDIPEKFLNVINYRRQERGDPPI